MIEQQTYSSTMSLPVTRRVWRLAISLMLLLVISLALFKGVAVASAAWNMYQSVMQLRALAATTRFENPVALQNSLERLAGDYDQFVREVEPLLPFIERLGFAPGFGALAVATPDILEAGNQAFILAQEGANLLSPTLVELRTAEPDASTADLLLQAVTVKAPALYGLGPGIESLRTTLATIDIGAMPERLTAPLQAATDLLSLAEVTRQLGPELPQLLGMDSPKTYLILVQNNHELRATGGFISAIGRLTIDKGKIAELDFVDSYAIYRTDGVYPAAPAAMAKYMNIPVLVMRDANWSPDFPTAAQVAQALYRSDTDIDVDGIVTVDLNAVRRIFGALGEIQVPGFDAPITGENIEAQIVQLWERPAESTIEVGGDTAQESGEWWRQRKDFIPRLAGAALDTVQGGKANIFRLTAAALHALDDRSIQVWLENPNAAAVMHAQGWDGSLRPTAGSDFLAVVDTNMGYNKVDAVMQRTLDYRVSWPDGADQPAQATLTLTYTHPIDAEDPGCDLTPRYGDAYDDLIARCYFDYVRVYAPAGSTLNEATGVEPDSIKTQRGERRTQVFTGYFILPPGESNVVTFIYTLPGTLTPEAYRLILQRQSGTQPLPATVTIDGVAESVLVEEAIWEWPVSDAEQ